MSETLKPCPFCGGSASIERYGTPRQSTIYTCDECGCRLETGEEWGHGSRWNTRALPLPAAGGANSPSVDESATQGTDSLASPTPRNLDEALRAGWKAAHDVVTYCVANWLQDMRTEAQQKALVDAGQMLADEIARSEPTEWLDMEWRSQKECNAALVRAQAERDAARRERVLADVGWSLMRARAEAAEDFVKRVGSLALNDPAPDDPQGDKLINRANEYLSREEPRISRRCEATCAGKEELDELNSSNPAPGGEEET